MSLRRSIPFMLILMFVAAGPIHAADPFTRADANGDGKLDLQEFTAAATEKFKKYDLNGDGYLDREEMKAAGGSCKGCMREFSAMDADRDGRISREEFLGGALTRFREQDLNGNGVLDRPEVDFRTHYQDPASIAKPFGGFYF